MSLSDGVKVTVISLQTFRLVQFEEHFQTTDVSKVIISGSER